MSENEILLRQTLADVFDLSFENINDDASTDTIETWDSVNHLKLILALESAYNVSLTEEQSVEILSLPLTREVLKEHNINF